MILKAYISNFFSVITHSKKDKKIQNKITPLKNAPQNAKFYLGNMAL